MQKIQLMQTQNREVNQLQANIAKAVGPLLTNPALFGLLIQDERLIAGTTMVLHQLGRNLQGWIIVRQRGPSAIYDTQDSNSAPGTWLQLFSSQPVTVDLYVF